MKYIKLFNQHSEYEEYKQSDEYIAPNVSYCIVEDEPHSSASSSICQPSTSTTLVNKATYPSTVAASATSFVMTFYQKSVIINTRCEEIIKTRVAGTASVEIEKNLEEEPRILTGTYTYSGLSFTYRIEQEGKNATSISSATVTSSNATYNGSNQVATNITVTLDGVTLVNNTDYTVTQNEGGTNVGTYPITVTGIGSYEGTASGTFTIVKANGSVATPPTSATSLVYNGSAQALLATAGSGTGTMLYKLGTSSWGTSIPSGTNASSYTVYYKASASTNYNESASGSVNCSIAKADITPSVSINYWTYGETPNNPSVNGNTGGGTVTYYYKLSTSSSWSTTKPSNAGTYDIRADIATTANYNSGTCYNVFSIVKANPTYTAPTANNRTYDATSNALLNGGSVTGGTMQYSTSQSGTYSTTIPTQTNAGTYTTWWKIVGDSNHNDKASASISTTISAKTVSSPTITLSQDSYVYNNTARQPSATVKDGTTTIDSNEYTVSYSDNTNVGTATCTITDKSGGNYTVSGSKTFTITCASCTAPTAKSLTWNGSAQALVNAGSTSYGTMVYSTDNSTWGTSIPSGTNATSYTVYWKVTGNTNVCCTASSSVSCSIAKAAMTYTAPNATTYEYDNTARALLSGGSANGGSIEYSTSQTGTYTTTVPTQTNAGTYTTWWKAVPDSNHSGGTNAASISTTIAKANITPTVSISNWTYGGTASNPSVNGNTGGGTITYYYKLSSDSSWSTTKPSNAGSYNIRADIAATANYNSGTCTNNFTIAKAAMTYTAPKATTYTYANTDRALLSGGSANGGSIQYSTSQTGTYSSTIPSQTNAGTYTTWWKAVPDSNHSGGTNAASISTTINCYSATAPTAKSLNWSGSAQALVNAGSTSYGTMVYSTTSSGSFSTTIPTGTNAGSYEVWWKVTGNTSVCNTAATKIDCSIKQVAMTYTAPTAKSLTWTGSGQALLNAGSATGGSIQYSTSQTGTYSSTIPSQTNAGTYTSWWKAVPDSNHSGGTNATSIDTTIAKAACCSTAPKATTYTYANTARALVSGGSSSCGTMQYSTSQSGTYSTTIPTQTNAGTYTTYWKVENDSNHSGTCSGSVSTTISKANGSVTTAPTAKSGLVYNGSSQALINAGSGTGTMMYKLDSGSWGTSIPSGTSANNNYTVYYKASASTNYNESSSGSVTCSIAKANISPTVSISNWTYGGTASNPSVNGNSGGGTITYYYKLSSASSWGTTKPSNAGSYNIRADIASTTNYNSGTCTNNFTINKANSSLSFSVTNLYVGKGETKTNAVTVNAGDGTVTYSSNNTTAITVNNSGVITGVGVGDATITANISSTNNYNSASASYTASCAISVTAKFNVTDTSSPTRIANATTSFNKIEVDGVVQPSVTTGYTFSTTGEHTVKYNLKNASIGYQAFTNCTNLTSIDIPDNVTSIDQETFSGCTSLTRVNSNIDGVFNLPSGLTSIYDRAFEGCTSLTNVTIPSGVTSIGNSAFYSCTGLTSCTIGSGVTSIGNYAFSRCSDLTSINIPDSVTSIGNDAFLYCSGLTSCTIGSGATSTGEWAFAYCSSLTNITIPSGVTSIGISAFYRCSGLTSCTICSGVTSIGHDAFYYCTSLTNINIPSGVTSISNNAFQGCSGLTSCTIGSGVTSIGDQAFYGCTRLTSIGSVGSVSSVEIPNSVTSIGDYAFRNCTSLTSCTIGSGVTSIGSMVFYGCSSMTRIDINNNSVPNDAFKGLSSIQTVTIGNSVTSIGTSAFSGCSSLTSCTIGSGVTSIGASAFTDCYSLTGIVIPSGVTSIDNNTFYWCTNLTSITIPNNITSIGERAFYNCSGLTSCTIGSGVTSIGKSAFSNCRSLNSITCNATTAPKIVSNTFYNVENNGILYVSIGSSGYDVWMGTGNYYLGKYNWTKVER